MTYKAKAAWLLLFTLGFGFMTLSMIIVLFDGTDILIKLVLMVIFGLPTYYFAKKFNKYFKLWQSDEGQQHDENLIKEVEQQRIKRQEEADQKKKEKITQKIDKIQEVKTRAVYLDGIQGWVEGSTVNLDLTKDQLIIDSTGNVKATLSTDQIVGYLNGTIKEISETYELKQKGGGVVKGLLVGGLVGAVNPVAGFASAIIAGTNKKSKLNKRLDTNKTRVYVINYESNGELKSLTFTDIKDYNFIKYLSLLVDSKEPEEKVITL